MKRKKSVYVKSALLLAVSLVLLSGGCRSVHKEEIKTILPPPVILTEPSFDNNIQDSGIKDYVEGRGFLISVKALARYNALVFLYGSKEVPPIDAEDGIEREGQLIYMSDEAMVNFITMSEKKNAGKK